MKQNRTKSQTQNRIKSTKQINQEAEAWAKKIYQTIGPSFKPAMKESAARNKALIAARNAQNKAAVTSFNKGQKADATRTANLLKQRSILDYKQVPHTEVDRNVNYTDSVIPGMPPQANITETVTAKGPPPPTDQEKLATLAALDKEISRLANLKSVPDESVPGDPDYDFVQSVNRAKLAHMARLVAKRNELDPPSANSPGGNPGGPPPGGNPGGPGDLATNIVEMTKANSDSVAAVLAQLKINPAKIDSTKKAEAEKKKNDPNNFSTNQKTNFRKAWRKKNAKALNSKDPKVSTPAKLKYQQLKDWRDGKIPFPDTLKNEL